jgi:hypothetical protein
MEVVMRVLLKVWRNPDFSDGCDYATVEMSEELAKLTLRRIGVLSEQSAADPSLYESYYWDSSAEYFSPWATRLLESEKQAELETSLAQTLERLELDTKETVIAPPDSRVPESQVAAVECAQMIVRDGVIAFTALLRHTDIYLTTAELPEEMIKSALVSAA